MRIVFWQNCLSPHQLPYIVRLLEDERVDVVVVAAGEDISDERRRMGWDVTSYPGLDRCEVYLNPMPQTVEHLLSVRTEDSYHLFSGIRGFPFVFKVFLRSLRYKLRRGLITERPNTYAFNRANGKPLWLHRIRFFFQDRKYASYIRYVFAMGDEAVDYFHSVWKKWEVFPFAYCTRGMSGSPVIPDIPIDTPPRFLFIGALSNRKAPLDILRADVLLKNVNGGGTISFIGNGSEYQTLSDYIQEHHLRNVNLLGTRNNSEIPYIMNEHDILILPSVYDGWGAVVNEALTQGLYVICSDRCGARELLGDPRCGRVFKGGDYKQLAGMMRDCVSSLPAIRADRLYRQKWAARCISGDAISRYMVDCLEGKDVKRPWM